MKYDPYYVDDDVTRVNCIVSDAVSALEWTDGRAHVCVNREGVHVDR